MCEPGCAQSSQACGGGRTVSCFMCSCLNGQRQQHRFCCSMASMELRDIGLAVQAGPLSSQWRRASAWAKRIAAVTDARHERKHCRRSHTCLSSATERIQHNLVAVIGRTRQACVACARRSTACLQTAALVAVQKGAKVALGHTKGGRRLQQHCRHGEGRADSPGIHFFVETEGAAAESCGLQALGQGGQVDDALVAQRL